MNIITNIDNIKKGETFCYHYGILAEDRNDGTNEPKTRTRILTDKADKLDKLATEIYNKSTFGEYILYQKRGEYTGKNFGGRSSKILPHSGEYMSPVPSCQIYNYYYMAKRVK